MTRQRLPTDREAALLIDDLVADLEDMRRVYRIVFDHSRRRPKPGVDSRPEDGDTAALRQFMERMLELHRAAQVVRGRMPEVFADRPELGQLGCVICGRPGPLRHGMCSAHSRAWYRAGQPPLEAFIAEARVRLDATSRARSPRSA